MNNVSDLLPAALVPAEYANTLIITKTPTQMMINGDSAADCGNAKCHINRQAKVNAVTAPSSFQNFRGVTMFFPFDRTEPDTRCGNHSHTPNALNTSTA